MIGSRGDRLSLQCAPARIGFRFSSIRRPSAAKSEQALGDQKVEHYGEIDDECQHLEVLDSATQLIDLKGNEDPRLDQCEVFRPSPSGPQPDYLENEYGDICHHRDANQIQFGR